MNEPRENLTQIVFHAGACQRLLASPSAAIQYPDACCLPVLGLDEFTRTPRATWRRALPAMRHPRTTTPHLAVRRGFC